MKILSLEKLFFPILILSFLLVACSNETEYHHLGPNSGKGPKNGPTSEKNEVNNKDQNSSTSSQNSSRSKPKSDIQAFQSQGERNKGQTSNSPQGENKNSGIQGFLGKHKWYKDQYIQTSKDRVDILWVIDNSSSMSNEQYLLAKNFDQFIDRFLLNKVDFRMAVTTTDSTRSKDEGIEGIDDGLDGNHACYWGTFTSRYAKKNENNFKKIFSECVKVGVRGDSYERGLNAVDRFLERESQFKPAYRFLRGDTNLAVFIVSDEEDDDKREVETYVNSILKTKSSLGPGKLRIYSVINATEKDISNQWETIGERYKLASKLTNGSVYSIRSDFGTTLANLSKKVLKMLKSFQLTHKPIHVAGQKKFQVTINGQESTHFTYNKDTNSLIFHPGHVPPTNSKIEIKYFY